MRITWLNTARIHPSSRLSIQSGKVTLKSVLWLEHLTETSRDSIYWQHLSVSHLSFYVAALHFQSKVIEDPFSSYSDNESSVSVWRTEQVLITTLTFADVALSPAHAKYAMPTQTRFALHQLLIGRATTFLVSHQQRQEGANIPVSYQSFRYSGMCEGAAIYAVYSVCVRVPLSNAPLSPGGVFFFYKNHHLEFCKTAWVGITSFGACSPVGLHM
jgi:hypothetical protein